MTTRLTAVVTTDAWTVAEDACRARLKWCRVSTLQDTRSKAERSLKGKTRSGQQVQPRTARHRPSTSSPDSKVTFPAAPAEAPKNPAKKQEDNSEEEEEDDINLEVRRDGGGGGRKTTCFVFVGSCS